MANETVGARSALAPVAALFAGIALLYLGYGLQVTLVPLRADVEGFSRFAIGLLGSTYYAGFVAGCLLAPYVILRVGHIRAFAAMVSCVSAAALAFPLALEEAAWMAFRLATGFCIAGLLVVIESWLNEKATNVTRGIVMSVYIVITYAAISVGQLGVSVQPLESFSLFALCSIILSLAALPVVLTRASQPAPIPVVRYEPRRIWRTAPAGCIGSFAAGLSIGSIFALGTIFAIELGYSANEAAIFVSACMLGGALGQYPFGRVSDFMDRRYVLLVAVALTTVVSFILVAAPLMPQALVLVLGLAVGFVLMPTYSIAAAHAYDRTRPEDMVPMSAALLVLFGVGSMVGPLLAAPAMSWFGPGGLFLVIALVSSLLALFVALRIFARARPGEAMRADFDYWSTAPVGGAVTPEHASVEDRSMELPTPRGAAPATPPEPVEDPAPSTTLHSADEEPDISIRVDA
ncbi:MFS transporter [Acuticoccus sp.]|uniref:MFS transporter n=1 Tax=Acuticoccus sp. TaxID=1904378 RepID=UPI003B529BE8